MIPFQMIGVTSLLFLANLKPGEARNSEPGELNQGSTVQKFDPNITTPISQYACTSCDYRSYDNDNDNDTYYDNYYDNDGGGCRESSTPDAPTLSTRNYCNPGSRPPKVLVLEIGSAFFDSLKGGEEFSKEQTLRSKKGIFHQAGDCYEFFRLESLNTTDNSSSLAFLISRIQKILFVVDYDLLPKLPTFSPFLRLQLDFLYFLLGDEINNHLITIVGHGHDAKHTSKIFSQVQAELEEKLFKEKTFNLMVMEKNTDFHADLLNNTNIRNGMKGPFLKISSQERPPWLFTSAGSKFQQKVFTVSGFFMASPAAPWTLKWFIGKDLLWQVEGQTGNINKEVLKSQPSSRSKVAYLQSDLYMATVWIQSDIQQKTQVTLNLNGHVGNVPVTITAWDQWETWSNCGPNLTQRRERNTVDKSDIDVEIKTCTVSGISQPNFCQSFKYPSPRILLLGGTGVGKSTLGNLLLGVNKGRCKRRGKCVECIKGYCKPGRCLELKGTECIKCEPGQCKKGKCAKRECLVIDNFKLGEVMPKDEDLPFEPGSSMDSKTNMTKPFTGQFLGIGPCVTLIDTPGAADGKGRDYEHAIEMAKFLKEEMKTFDLILLMQKGNDRRFSLHTIALLKFYQQIFGKEMWRNVIVEMSFWSHKEEDSCGRQEAYEGLKEDQHVRELNQKLKSEFGVEFTVPVLFIDPILKVFHPSGNRLRTKIETRELDIFKNQTKTLWRLAKAMKPYECSSNCQAPDDFYLGKPWIQGITSLEEGETNFVVPCKIWDGVVTGGGMKNSDEIRWYFNNELLFQKDTEDQEIYIAKRALAVHGFKVTPPIKTAGSFFATSQIVIGSVNGEKHQGNYRCQNKKGNSTWNLKIPHWSSWGIWSPCTKSCKTYQGQGQSGLPGTRTRKRMCVGHIDQNTTCSSSQGGAEQPEDCTGDNGVSDIFCPIPPLTTEWSGWSKCTKNCGVGEQSRARTCEKGQFHANPADNTCPTKYGATHEKEDRKCNTHNCSKSCVWAPWGGWGACSQTCRSGKELGTKTRERLQAVTASGGGDECKGGTEESMTCGQHPECPVDGQWSEWKDSGSCTNDKGCGRGKQTAERTCDGRKGAGQLCLTKKGHESGYEEKYLDCDLKHCPIDCVLTEWSTPKCTAPCGKSKTVYSSRWEEVSAQHDGKSCGAKSKPYTCHGNECPSTVGEVVGSVLGGAAAVAAAVGGAALFFG